MLSSESGTVPPDRFVPEPRTVIGKPFVYAVATISPTCSTDVGLTAKAGTTLFRTAESYEYECLSTSDENTFSFPTIFSKSCANLFHI